MKFVFEMARRELRASWRRLLFFFVCIAIGVGAIVALKSMTQNINLAVSSEARSLLTADVQVDSNRPWNKETLEVIERVNPERAYLTHMSHEFDYEVLPTKLPGGVFMGYDGLRFQF